MKKIEFPEKRPLLMGVLNLTPDSFSDGGEYNTLQKAIKRAHEIEKQGADIIDIGGESTGPGSKNISLEEELKRIISVLKKIRQLTKLPISVDTYKAEVAHQALEEGADIINDVTSLRGDSQMAALLAKYTCPLIMMYSKDKTARTTIKKKHYSNVIKTIENFFKRRLSYAKKNGVKKSQIILDPGMGQFISAIPFYSWEIITRLHELKRLGHPILLGVSRKSFLGGKMESRVEKGLIASTIAYLNGASILRTHDIKATKEFFDFIKN